MKVTVYLEKIHVHLERVLGRCIILDTCNKCFNVKYCGIKCQECDYETHNRVCYPLDRELILHQDNHMVHQDQRSWSR